MYLLIWMQYTQSDADLHKGSEWNDNVLLLLDAVVAEKLGWAMCGGDLDGSPKVSEQYLLDLEREAFLSLMGQKRTLERIQHMLKTGKPLRN